ncbi:TonB family domain protein [Neisseria sp. oral taxon 020 str. F0370]|uniref:energy transducer TonB n=1 Tax=unclassified Neisseria TaxID=2623750 RepID=UPI0002A1BDD0|nr:MULTISPECIES: energy transducer TonB [unclassified Neisseria]ASP16610.1 energy transducer TonB [Neisseria sp. KEM232]EKY09078.1 TonB family domain protein [Neisseria sp. oral taxon 020 str. F0370]
MMFPKPFFRNVIPHLCPEGVQAGTAFHYTGRLRKLFSVTKESKNTMSRPLILLSAALLLAAPAVQAAPKAEKAAKKTPAAAAGRQDAEETVLLPPVFRDAETDKTGFPQTGRAIWRLHADANGKVVRREQETDRAVAKQAAAIGNLPQEFPPRERCGERQSQSGASETVCRKVPFTVVQEAYFVIPQNLAADKTQFAEAVQTVPPRPVYPPLSMENGEEGTSVVRAAVAPDGRAYGAHTEKSSGHRLLDRFAVKGMDAARFQPARYRGKPVWQAVVAPIAFRL